MQFGKSLTLRVVAEGVEDASTLAYLRDLGCDLVQGYHIAKPLPVGQIPDWLSNNTTPGRTPLHSAAKSASRRHRRAGVQRDVGLPPRGRVRPSG